jgi:hypothetical protein
MANYISNTRCCRFCHAYSDSLIATATAEGTAYAHILGELLVPIAGALR